jgi:hypothetical protein
MMRGAPVNNPTNDDAPASGQYHFFFFSSKLATRIRKPFFHRVPVSVDEKKRNQKPCDTKKERHHRS